jgi:hypothetical protein
MIIDPKQEHHRIGWWFCAQRSTKKHTHKKINKKIFKKKPTTIRKRGVGNCEGRIYVEPCAIFGGVG